MAQHPTFVITMEDGRQMKGELYPEIAPQSVGNFAALANSGFYDGVIFHRVIPGLPAWAAPATPLRVSLRRTA